MSDDKIRCSWCLISELDTEYHDTEWGVPEYDDQNLFEMLCLEGMQAGLSWSTVLKKRERYREVFDKFDASKIKDYDSSKVEELLQDKGIIRNKLKVNAIITNAKAYLIVQKEFGSFSKYIWNFVDHKIIQNEVTSRDEVLSTSPISDAMSKDLKKRGFKFVGSTICYAFMQAAGLVNDHTTDCFRHQELL
ncbi:DNA-3-methyladenine glycosylase I [Flammeovirga sp. SubArs3]|uniref:DNA-3-methyladenine glycosylase I n=1 Tax=Flammeovirga sp. SubArs3 TaxID=2995316 RepID=UPI00248AAEA4|nr:DNA-3-methyladenine glycosylase I [Flammeovirga sp. SubArs3]